MLIVFLKYVKGLFKKVKFYSLENIIKRKEIEKMREKIRYIEEI